MARRKAVIKAVQLNLFGEPIKPEEQPRNEVHIFDFESHPLRTVMVKGIPWWVLADAARILEYASTQNAEKHLRDKEKGYAESITLGGAQTLKIINLSGLLRLVMRSNMPKATEFQDWVTEIVLPSILYTGGYTANKDNRVAHTARRLKTDIGTAIERVKNCDRNKVMHARLAEEGACPRQFANYHNAIYRGQFGVACKTLRKSLQLSKRGTPLDRMSGLLLAQNTHAKWLADRVIRESPGPLAPTEQCEIAERLAYQITAADLTTLGQGYQLGITVDPHRGRVLDVVRALTA